ncbi:MAG: Rne/Rng family ribonuclease [Acidobacteria bacterium]|nr:Rne/Rng family ribonuclease [Acidobacteriota bacterium]
MSKEMIISVNGREKKIAILDNGRVTEFYIERGEENSGIAGNIYKGRVQRVLPGMQSAFVSIGLERDAFLYVSDFFDEEEEIERIVMEKSKKGSQEDAKREANERIERSRIEREKQMESAQDLAEPLAEAVTEKIADEPTSAKPAEKKGRGRRGRGKQEAEVQAEQAAAPLAQDQEEEIGEGSAIVVPGSLPEMDDSGFERIVDEEDTGELFKDAYRQEAIVDQVRLIEFDMESTEEAEVGSLLGSMSEQAAGFERIADEDEADAAPAKKTSKRTPKAKAAPRSKKAKAEKEPAESAVVEAPASETADDADEVKKPAKKTRSTKAKTSTAKAKTTRTSKAKTKKAEAEPLEDGEASVKEAADTAAMSVRRGGRGRRRGGRPKKAEATETDSSLVGFEDIEVDAPGADDAAAAETAADENETVQTGEDAAETSNGNGEERSNRNDRGPRQERGGRNRRDKGQRDDKRHDRNDRNDRQDRRQQPTISDLLREGQEVLVQIAKEPIAKKGARITSHIALPGRFLVYMPTIEHLGVSRKIESSNERGRLRTLIQRIRTEEDIPSGGFIVRTAGIGISEEDLRQDARYLVRTWLDIKKTSEKAKSPALVHQDLDIVQRLLRDQLSDDFTAIRVDSEEEYLRTVEFINRIQPRMVNRVKLYTREAPILEAYNVQEEIDKALKPRVWLKSGGYLVINQTEALVAIDVNTGKFVGKGNARLEDTITRTNMEAVDEIARQIRLRDLGGIIVLDLIDMEDRRNRHKVSQALQEALSSDKSPTKVLSFNDFGLIIMTRKRVKQSLERTMCAPCEYCEGAGWVKSPQTTCYEILAEARRLSKELDDVRQTTLRIHPEVAKALRSSERTVLEEIEAYLGSVDLTADPHIHQAQYDFAFI